MSDAARSFVGVMRHEDQAGLCLRHDPIHRCQQGLALRRVQSLTWFVEDEQARTFHRGTGEENQSLLAKRKFTERCTGVCPQSQILQPLPSRVPLGVRTGFVKADCVEEP